MFERYTEIQTKRKSGLNFNRKIYSLSADKKEIGSLRETGASSTGIGNKLLKLTNLFNMAGMELDLFDTKKNRMGKIKKEKGMDKSLFLFSENGAHIATVKLKVKSKLPRVTVVDPEGNELARADGNYGATDFSITDSGTSKQVSYVKKRPLEDATFKEQLCCEDSYFNIHSRWQEESITFALIAMCVALDLYFHN